MRHKKKVKLSMTQKCLQLKVDSHFQIGCMRTSEYVQQVPDLINGFKLYVVNATLEDYSDDTADLRYFDLKTSSKTKYAGIWKGRICQGSWECPNPHCTFKCQRL